MPSLTQIYHDVCQAKLSRRVATWVFLSLMTVEGIVLIPSIYNRSQELLKQKEQVSSELLAATRQTNMQGESIEKFFQEFVQKIGPESVIKGAALYTQTGEFLGSFGTIPTLKPQNLNNHDRLTKLTNQAKNYEVAWRYQNHSSYYILIVCHDASDLIPNLVGYLGRIALAVLVISLVVTGSTMAVVTITVITPFLKLRDDFTRAIKAISNREAEPCFSTLQSIQFHAEQSKGSDEMTEVFQAFHQMFNRIYQEIEQRQQAEIGLRLEQEKSERLLVNILPKSIAERLKQEEGAIAEKFESVTILFADLVNFTHLASQTSPVELVCLLNDIFSRFDTLVEQLGLEKIKTIGDAYMVVGGVPEPREDHAQAIATLALEMQRAIESFNQAHNQQFQLRIGINTGPVVAGVIGRQKFAYDLWGDTVNVASRMESHGEPGKIQVTTSTYDRIKDDYVLDYRGSIMVKGRGSLETYFLTNWLTPNPTKTP